MNPFHYDKLTIAVFDKMCAAHDLTFSQSDNFREWQKGSNELKCITKAMSELGYENTIPIWNKHVKKKLAASYHDMYFWKVPTGNNLEKLA